MLTVSSCGLREWRSCLFTFLLSAECGWPRSQPREGLENKQYVAGGEKRAEVSDASICMFGKVGGCFRVKWWKRESLCICFLCERPEDVRLTSHTLFQLAGNVESLLVCLPFHPLLLLVALVKDFVLYINFLSFFFFIFLFLCFLMSRTFKQYIKTKQLWAPGVFKLPREDRTHMSYLSPTSLILSRLTHPACRNLCISLCLSRAREETHFGEAWPRFRYVQMKRRLNRWLIMSPPAGFGRHGGTLCGLPSCPLCPRCEPCFYINRFVSNVYLSRSISMTLPLRSCDYYQSQMWRQHLSRAVARAWRLKSLFILRFFFLLLAVYPLVLSATSVDSLHLMDILAAHELLSPSNWSLMGQCLKIMQKLCLRAP